MVAAGEQDETLAKARRYQWTQISPASQASFATSLIPGLEVPEEAANIATALEEGLENHDSGRAEPPPPPEEPADDFCLVLMWPQRVDHLELKGEQRRHVYSAVGDMNAGEIPSGSTDAVFVEDGNTRDARQGRLWTRLSVQP